jgi:RimJ/RimL family protein N-acetyltransferase
MLRAVIPEDQPIFFDQQDDEVASTMAAVARRDREAHEQHWLKITADDAVIMRTIVEDDAVVGNILSFIVNGERNIGYWIGRQYWGRGYASAALRDYLQEIDLRPLIAHVAEHNGASLRVLEKCGFTMVGAEMAKDDRITVVVLRLD